MPRNELTEIEKRQTKIAIRLAVFFTCLILIDFLLISIFFSWQDWIATLLFSLLFILPAYISNAGMVVVGGGKPIDGGRCLKDGYRILGDHKTWSGAIKGPLYIGIPISIGVFIVLILLWPSIIGIPMTGLSHGKYKIYTDIKYYEYYFVGGKFPLGLVSIVIRVILCSYGAVIGDLIGAFFKRRLNIKSGAPFWIVDQIDFALVAIVFIAIAALVSPLFLIPDINIIIFICILTPSVSIIANTVAYFIGLKDVPW